MDLSGLQTVLRAIEGRQVRLITRDLTQPSPLAQEILNARPYAFLDDAPLEERRTQAVISRRWLDPVAAADLGRLDGAAIALVQEEAWPEVTTHDELHDALLSLIAVETEAMTPTGPGRATVGWSELFARLLEAGRATIVTVSDAVQCWVATERLAVVRGMFPHAASEPEVTVPAEFAQLWSREEAVIEWVRARLSVVGPVTLAELCAPLVLQATEVQSALLALESEGFVLRGSFRSESGCEEWCERRLLARMHQYTVRRLRREIEPASVTQFMRFLLRWQRVDGLTPFQGIEGLAAVLQQLEGYQAPVIAWERELLPARLRDFEPAWLDQLCLSGQVTWRRWRAEDVANGSHSNLMATAGIVLLQRRRLADWCSLCTNGTTQMPVLSPDAQRVFSCLSSDGASFIEDITRTTGLLRTQTEQALGELVAKGLVHADSFMSLRKLLHSDGHRRSRKLQSLMQVSGRWSLTSSNASVLAAESVYLEEAVETVARTLLLRYGVIMRGLLAGESRLPPWRDLVRVYRRLEARGELRGGRFVASVSGEQFALPEAIGLLRELKRQGPDGILTVINATDPLNLSGNFLPGERIPALVNNRLLFRDGELIAALQGKVFRCFIEADSINAWDYRQQLLRLPGHAAARRPGVHSVAGYGRVLHAN